MRQLLLAVAVLAAVAASTGRAEYLTPAGRGPIPAEGETIARPIVFVRLQPEKLPTLPDRPLSWQETGTYAGQFATVQGKVIDTGNIGHMAFLNFTPYRRDSKDFSVVIFKEVFDAIPGPPEKVYLNQWVRVTGPITTHKGRPNIEVRDVKMIEIIDEPKAATAPTAASSGAIPWIQAGAHVGQTITATGTIVDTKDIGNLTFLNFTTDKGGFYAVVFKEAYAGFPAPPEQYLRGKSVQVTGKVTLHKDRPQIQVRDAKQIIVE